jgi:hypothetical protein
MIAKSISGFGRMDKSPIDLQQPRGRDELCAIAQFEAEREPPALHASGFGWGAAYRS